MASNASALAGVASNSQRSDLKKMERITQSYTQTIPLFERYIMEHVNGIDARFS